MSKAFTDEEAGEDAPIVAPRALLPPGVPNYVTPGGLELLRRELAALSPELSRANAIASEKQRGRALGALTERRIALERRIATAEVVSPPSEAFERVRFGAEVTVTGSSGERSYRIVGVDEADPAQGAIAFTSPLARALLGRAVGEMVRWRTPRGEEELSIVALD